MSASTIAKVRARLSSAQDQLQMNGWRGSLRTIAPAALAKAQIEIRSAASELDELPDPFPTEIATEYLEGQVDAAAIQRMVEETAALDQGGDDDARLSDLDIASKRGAGESGSPLLGCRREFPDRSYERCGKPATHIVWGELFDQDVRGPRCEDCLVDQCGWRALRDPAYAVYRLPSQPHPESGSEEPLAAIADEMPDPQGSQVEREWRVANYAPEDLGWDNGPSHRPWKVELWGPQPSNHERLVPKDQLQRVEEEKDAYKRGDGPLTDREQRWSIAARVDRERASQAEARIQEAAEDCKQGEGETVKCEACKKSLPRECVATGVEGEHLCGACVRDPQVVKAAKDLVDDLSASPLELHKARVAPLRRLLNEAYSFPASPSTPAHRRARR
jgi:hypothetical protein